MATLKYFVRTTKMDKDILHNINIKFRHNEKYMFCKSGFSIELDCWNSNTQRIPPKKQNNINLHLNGKLDKLEKHILSVWAMEPNKENLDSKWLQKQVNTFTNLKEKPQKVSLFVDYIKQFVSEAEKDVNDKTGKKLAINTLKKYRTSRDKLEVFSNKFFPDLELKGIDYQFYKQYKSYLTFEQNLAANSVGKEIGVLKRFINASKNMGYTINLEGFVKPSEKTDNIYLNEAEIERIYQLDLSSDTRLERVRDLFIVGCLTGKSFEDLTNNETDDVRGNMLHYFRVKTGNEAVVPFHEKVQAIYSKYGNNLPTDISNQKFNDYVKEVCEKAEINEMIKKRITKSGVITAKAYPKYDLVSSHTARRSFATNLYLEGFPTISIMAATGHKTERAFLDYIKVTPAEHAQKLKEHWEKQVVNNKKKKNEKSNHRKRNGIKS